MPNYSRKIESSLILILAGILLVFIASVMTLVSFKVGYWPWEIDWLNEGAIASPVLAIIFENAYEVAALGISTLLVALYAAIGFRDLSSPVTEFDAALANVQIGDYQFDSALDDENFEMAEDSRGDRSPGAGSPDAEGPDAGSKNSSQQMIDSIAPENKARESQLQIALSEVNRLKKELVVSRRETEAAEKARAQFLSNMSHELRTPMNGIMGMSELLNECDLPEKEKRFAKTIASSSESLLSIINDLLDYSRMEAGDMRLEQARFDIGACAEEVCGILASSAQSKGVELICYVDEELPKFVEGDAARFRQVLNNLIRNSIAFTCDGEIVIRLSRTESTELLHMFKCDVQDTGSGISPELQARLFESFNQADHSNTRQHGGLGIGLAITNELVSLMGGDLMFRSRLGEGTRFTFSCQFQRVADEDAGKLNAGNFGGATVLIVDDNATNRSILFHQVTGWGLEAECAESGAQALSILNEAAAENKLFDMLILDLHMPEMDGIELTRRIRSTPAIASTKAMMLTSAIIELSASEMRQLGIETYISKPARQSQLRECLRDLIFTNGNNNTQATENDDRKIINDSPTKVLLAEDDAINLDVAVAMLESLHCSVDTVANGEQAVVAADKRLFDLIFMDCQMPILDGFSAAGKIKAGNGPNVSTPIVALTAKSMPGDRKRCLDAGMQDFIGKPVSKSQIANVIKIWTAANVSDDSTNVFNIRTPDINLSDSGEAAKVSDSSKLESPAVEQSRAEVVNMEAINKIRELQRPGKADLLSKVLALYFEKSPEQLIQLQQAVNDADFEQAKAIAHGMKSSSAYLGAEQLASTCGELEESIRNNDTDSAATLADAILQQYDLVEAELQQHIKAA